MRNKGCTAEHNIKHEIRISGWGKIVLGFRTCQGDEDHGTERKVFQSFFF